MSEFQGIWQLLILELGTLIFRNSGMEQITVSDLRKMERSFKFASCTSFMYPVFPQYHKFTLLFLILFFPSVFY